MSAPKPGSPENGGPTASDTADLARLKDYGQFLERFLLSRGCPPGDVLDIVQDTFEIFWRKRQVVEPAKELAFLQGVARRTLLNHYRKLNSRQTLGSKHLPLIAGQLHGEPATVWAGLVEHQERQQVEQLLRHLPPRMALIMQLLCLRGKTHKETAALCGITLSTVLKTEAKALKKLKALGTNLKT